MAPPLGTKIKECRRFKGVSQRWLSIQADISEKHISHIENGRSRPGKSVLERICDALEVSPSEENELFSLAGFAEPYPNLSTAENDPSVQSLKQTVELLLSNHTCGPAYVMNGLWHIVDANKIGRALIPSIDSTPVDAIELMLNPTSPNRVLIENYQEVAWGFFRRLRSEFGSSSRRDVRQRLELASDYMKDVPKPKRFDNKFVLRSTLRLPDDRRIHSTTMLTRFSDAREINFRDLQVELVFPLDEASTKFYQEMVVL